MWRCVDAADYRGALAVCKRGLKTWPQDFQIQSAHAAILGDYAEQLPPRRMRPLKKRCVRLLRGLVHRLRGVDATEAFRARNEYYYHSGQFRKQYLLGREGLSRGIARAIYSQGVGAAWHARQLAEGRRPGQARLWARKSVKAWEAFFRTDPEYYNAYVHYALALGLLNRPEEMERALRRAGKLSGRPASFGEFQEIREIVHRLRLPSS